MSKRAFKFTVTVEVIDPNIYTIDGDGYPVGPPVDSLGDAEVAGYIAEAVQIFGGQFAPGDPLFPTNIKSVRVRNRMGKIDLITSGVRGVPEENDDDPS